MSARRIVRFGRMACLLALLAVACNRHSPAADGGPSPLQLRSPSFSEVIPGRYASCRGGANVSPALKWSAAPGGTRSFALIVTDPDAPGGTFTHWLLWNLPASTRSLPESVPAEAELASGARQGRNGFGDLGYGGPCPPGGSTHRYVFELYALDAPLSLAAGATKPELLHAMQGHIVASGRLVGRYPE